MRACRDVAPNTWLHEAKPHRAHAASKFHRSAEFANPCTAFADKLNFDDLAPAIGYVTFLRRRLAFDSAAGVSHVFARIRDNRAVVCMALSSNLCQHRL